MITDQLKHDDVNEQRVPPVQVDRPTVRDGRALWRIADRSGALDANSPYAYLMWSRDFQDTSVVARVDGEIVGFVTGYVRPDAPRVLFVWQVAVARSHRGRGVARLMLEDLLDRVRGHGVQFLETTVTPANEASTRLFTALARDHRVAHARGALFTPELFPEQHDLEELHQLGPWPELIRTTPGDQ